MILKNNKLKNKLVYSVHPPITSIGTLYLEHD